MKQKELYKTAIYCRLSLDDGSDVDSSSIHTQKMLLEKYCKDNGYEIYDYYIDDGYSGLNYNRPNFQRMLQDIENGKIDLVITKDLSRLGRDYIMTGYYTEIYFNEKGVRYIAVNDNIDTINDNNDIAPFKNILNDMYAKDISRKVKSAKRLRMHKGYYISCQPPYGYKVNHNDPNQLVIDEEVVDIVKLIFRLALNNNGVVKIVQELNKRGIDTPSIYKSKKGDKRCLTSIEQRKSKFTYDEINKWNTNTVGKILRDIVYIGDMENHKYEVKNYKTKKRTRVPKEEHIIVQNTHEAIISRNDFNKVQDLIKGRQRPSKYDFPNIFKGILRCANCGRKLTIGYHLRKSGRRAYSYQCYDRYLKHPTDTEANSIRYEVIYQIVDERIKDLFNNINVYGEEFLLSVINSVEIADGLTELKNQKEKINQRLNVLSNLVSKVFEDYASNLMSFENYQFLLNKYQDEQKSLNLKLREIDNKLTENLDKPLEKIKKFMEVAKNYLNYEELTKELISNLIDHIIVGHVKIVDGKKTRDIRIVYRFLS